MKIKRYIKLQYLKILRLNDAPDKIAKGVALGVGLDFLPLPFISLVVAYIFAKIARFNTVAAVMTAAFLKWAVFTIFWPMNVFLGKLLLGQGVPPAVETIEVAEPGLSLASLISFFSLETLSKLGKPFLLGSAINAVVFAMIAFYALRPVLRYQHNKKKERRARRMREKLSLSRSET